MSELRFEPFPIPAATLGRENPLPHLASQRDIHADVAADASVPEEIRRQIGYGKVNGCLPYGMQDSYNRIRKPRAFRAAVLENETLRATFLPELGGRLWSLIHKPTGRELLFANPVFQPANLAIRNAWFSGGVEWNIGMIGHTPLTCSPLFAARVRTDDGTPVLRLYEWERIRQVPYQIDAWLPDGSAFLFVRVRILNPHDTDCPMYWWSNMAVPEAPGTRILVPASSAYRLDYKNGMTDIPIPHQLGTDISYPTRIDRSVDYFFNIPKGNRPWVASLDRAGAGLIQTSTPRLRGRKLFVWGTCPGGRRWQEFLSVPGQAYVEIQAGLARTQAECLPMPAGAEWAWLEAYGLMQADPAAVHDEAWEPAWRSVQDRLDRALRPGFLEQELDRTAAMADRPPEAIAQRGSGWGALERRRREKAGIRPFCGAAMPFDNPSLGNAQKPWLQLLDTGNLPAAAPDDGPGAWLTQPEWRSLLEASVRNDAGDHALAWLHLGAMRHQANDLAGARAAWERSLTLGRTPWALRNLAILARNEKRLPEAAALIAEAQRLAPANLPLAIECGDLLLKAGRPEAWLDRLGAMPSPIRHAGRIQVLEIKALVELGRYDEAERMLLGDLVVEDLREGENALTEIWFDLQARRLAAGEQSPVTDTHRARARKEHPLPRHLDFRGQSST